MLTTIGTHTYVYAILRVRRNYENNGYDARRLSV